MPLAPEVRLQHETSAETIIIEVDGACSHEACELDRGLSSYAKAGRLLACLQVRMRRYTYMHKPRQGVIRCSQPFQGFHSKGFVAHQQMESFVEHVPEGELDDFPNVLYTTGGLYITGRRSLVCQLIKFDDHTSAVSIAHPASHRKLVIAVCGMARSQDVMLRCVGRFSTRTCVNGYALARMSMCACLRSCAGFNFCSHFLTPSIMSGRSPDIFMRLRAHACDSQTKSREQ